LKGARGTIEKLRRIIIPREGGPQIEKLKPANSRNPTSAETIQRGASRTQNLGLIIKKRIKKLKLRTVWSIIPERNVGFRKAFGGKKEN